MLRRNIGHGRVLEGLEVRWGLVVRVLQALTRLGPWRGSSGALGPMHKWYDPRLFDLLSEDEVRRTHAPKVWRGELVTGTREAELRAEGFEPEAVDVRTAAEMEACGFAVRMVGAAPSTEAAPERDTVSAIDHDVFAKWLEVREFRLGQTVAEWWTQLPPGASPAFRVEHDDTTNDFHANLGRHLSDLRSSAVTKLEHAGVDLEAFSQEASLLKAGLDDLERHVIQHGASVTIPALVRWCQAHVATGAFSPGACLTEDLEDELEMELQVAADFFSGSMSRGCLETAGETDDVDAEALGLAQSLISPALVIFYSS